jgi:hypothetical protein
MTDIREQQLLISTADLETKNRALLARISALAPRPGAVGLEIIRRYHQDPSAGTFTSGASPET